MATKIIHTNELQKLLL